MLRSQDEKLLLFSCGHAYHGYCCKRRICEVCKNDEIKKGNFLTAARSSRLNA